MATRYPAEFRKRILELRDKGYAIKEMCRIICDEYPVHGPRFSKNCRRMIHYWRNNTHLTNTETNATNTNIIDCFQLTHQKPIGTFEDIVETIPKLLEEKKQERDAIEEQIKQLEAAYQVLGNKIRKTLEESCEQPGAVPNLLTLAEGIK